MATSTVRLAAAVVSVLEADLPALVVAEGKTAITDYLAYPPLILNTADAPLVWVDVPEAKQVRGFAGGDELQRAVMVWVNAYNAADPETSYGDIRTYHDLIRRVMDDNQDMGGEASSGGVSSKPVQFIESKLRKLDDEGTFIGWEMEFMVTLDVEDGEDD